MTQWTLALALAGTCVGTITDLRTRTIPNWLTLPLPLCGLLLHGLERGLAGLLFAAVGALVCFLPVYVLFQRNALGGGDVKLFTALGALVGARDGLELELTAFLLVALFALMAMAWKGRLLQLLSLSWRASLHLLAPLRFPRPDGAQGGVELPMGLAIMLATLALAARSSL
jgi:prepilin peptidase CpaA